MTYLENDFLIIYYVMATHRNTFQIKSQVFNEYKRVEISFNLQERAT